MKMRLLITGAPCKNPCPRTWRGHPARVSWASRPCREGLFRSLFAALVLGSIASVSAAGGFRGFRFTQHPQSQIADENGQATLSVAVEGTGPFSYQWYKDAQPVVGATGQTMAISNIGCGGDALYHCVVTSPGGTATTHIANVSSALCAVAAWGENVYGQCDVPAGLADVVAVEGGTYHSLALKADGTVVAWGANWDGQCDVPAGLEDVVAVSAGADHSLALAEPKPPRIILQPTSVAVHSGQRVDLMSDVFSLLPCTTTWFKQGVADAVGTGTTWIKADVQVADAGNYYLVASNALGVVTSEVVSVVVDPTPFVAILPCRYSDIPLAGESLTLTANAWGERPMTYTWVLNGQTVLTSTTPEWTLPVLTEALTGICQLIVSNSHGTAASRLFNLVPIQPGLVAAWGENVDGQCDVPAGLADVVAVEGGTYHSLALKADGTVIAWGANWDGQCDIPAGLADVVAVAAGEYHSLALKADGTVITWGANWYGQCDVPPFCSPSLDIAAGWFQSLSIIPDSDGDGVADAVELDLGRDPNDPSDGDVAVSAAGRVSSPSGAIDGAVVTLRGASGWIYCRTTTDANGSYAIGEVIPGHYRIKVEASGFADQWYAGAEHAGGALDCAIMGTSPVAMPDFLLVPGQSPALVEVTSDPPGAAIYLDFHPTGEVTPAVIDVGEIGTFDSAGTLLASHVITLKRHGAPQPVPRTIAPVEAETIVEHFDLTDETSGAVLVETTPAGAEVFVDYADAPVGVTPVLVENLAPGFHTVLLRKEGYLRPRPVTARVLPHTGLAERSQANSFAAIGAAQGWQADDDCWGVVLPSRSRSMVSIEPTSLSTATGR